MVGRADADGGHLRWVPAVVVVSRSGAGSAGQSWLPSLYSPCFHSGMDSSPCSSRV